jgi:protein-S-isoprenylcysteine O-methyltransferase Ste14
VILDFMSFTTIFIIAGVILFVIFILILKLAIRAVVKASVIGVILLALLGAGGFWWWSTQLAGKPKLRQTSSPTPSRRSAR